jgi:two-component sensor histidine kinase
MNPAENHCRPKAPLILYLDDNPRDAERVRDILQQSELACELRLVGDREAYEAALAQTRFDLILSADALPDCDGTAALALARERQPDVPFILLSCTLGEEQAVDCVLRGATDFVLKQRPNRLVPAILRALTEAGAQQHRREAEAALRLSEERLSEERQRQAQAMQDITQRQQVEAALRDSLRDKDVLLQEIHHRVKNNLQIVSSLLHLQTDQAAQPTVKAVFKEAQRRVLSIALIHESLYRSPNLAQVNLAEYIETLCTHVFRSFGVDGAQIKLVTRLEPVALGLEQAVPCGLIVNELLSNALKYAFPSGRTGQITLTLSAPAGQVHLQVADNGVGLPPPMETAPARPPGLGLVSMLAKQLKGEVVVERGEGAAFQLTFPLHRA